MNVLIACERSGTVREAFRRRGHNAVSCDLAPAEDGSIHHLQEDALVVLRRGCWDPQLRAYVPWNLVIAHPPCTRLALSGALRLYRDGKKRNGIDPKKWTEMIRGAIFFRAFFESGYTGKLCVENPQQHGHAMRYHGKGPSTQTIQPHQFGADASKATCLWLRGLPPLIRTHAEDPDLFAAVGPQPRYVNGLPRYANQTDGGFNKLPPSPTRAIERSKTYDGIAEAMAEQWGSLS